MSGLRPALVLTTLVALGPSPSAAWIFTFPSLNRTTAARDLAFAPDGTIVAAGSLDLSIQRPYVVVRLDPEDGSTTGFYFHGFGRDGQANAVTMHGDEAIAAGQIRSASEASRFVVTRSTPDGGEVWGTELDGTASCGDDVANAVAVDPDGDVLAGGSFTNAGVGTIVATFAVVKLAIADGSVAWRREIDDGIARALVLDGADVIAVGGIGGSFSVVKVNGLTGDLLWETDLGAGEGAAIVAGAQGVVYVAGQVGGAFGVAKLATDTGETLWPNGVTTIEGPGVGRAVALVPGGDVVAAGETGVDPARAFVTARLDQTTGSIVWTQADPTTPQPAAAYGVAVGAVDHVVSVGTAAWDGGPASFASRSDSVEEGLLQWGNGIISQDAGTRATVVRFDANGDVVQAGQLALFGFAPGFTVRKLHGADGSDYQPLCGNDQLDPGEECDDGNRVDGDCCSSKCTFESAGSPCPDDGNDCRSDLCDGQGTCTHTPVTPGTSCDDTNDCTIGDHCNSDGVCVATTFANVGTPCDADSNDCTTDACNQSGQCIATPNNDPCDDQDPCTTNDTCAAGFCVGTPQTGGSCDDFDPCTANDTCQQGVCSGTLTPGLPCFDDGNPCTDDVCGAETCEHHPNAAPCDDADACTSGDQCANGVCGGAAVPPGFVNVTGAWAEIYHCTAGWCAGQDFPDTIDLVQAPGSSSVSGSDPSGATITGTLAGFSLSLTETLGGYVATFQVTVAQDGQSWSGTLSDNNGSSGTDTATRTSGITTTTTTPASTTTTTTTIVATTTTTTTVTSSTSTTTTVLASTTTTSTTTTTHTTSTTTTAPTTSTTTTTHTTSTTTHPTSTTTSTTLVGTPGPGCADGTREGLVDVETFPNIAACAGVWTGPVADGAVLCEEGWQVCNPDDEPVLQTVTYQDATAFPGCFAYDAAEDGNTCQPCSGTSSADDMAGMGQSCTYQASGAASCITGGRVDATCCSDYTSGTACQYKPGLTTGVVCCRQTTVTTTSTTTTTTLPFSCPPSRNAVTVSFPDFSSTEGLSLNGAATPVEVDGSTVLRIVPAAFNRSGSFFSTTALRAADFSTSFTFRSTAPGGSSDGVAPGGDGFVFVIQPVSSSIGTSGGGLGYAGITPSVGVEFDTYRNPEYSDPSSNHVGIDVDGDVTSVATADLTPDFDDGNLWYVWIDYDGATLEVRANETGVRPSEPLLRQALDIPTVIDSDTAFVGFTAGTGAAYGNYDIVSWTYFDHCQPVVTTTTTTATITTTTTTTLPPACTTAADCDDGDPCNGGEPCIDGRCGVSQAVTANACRGADPLAIVTSFGTDAVVVCNTRTRTVETTVPVGRAPWGIAWRPTGDRVFVTNREDATVSVIDMATRTVVGTVAVDEQPLGIAVHPFLPRAYVASYKTDRIDVIDTASLSVIDRIAVGNGPSGVAVHPAGASLYVANYIAGTLSVVDVATGKVTATIATPALPVGVAIHPAGTKVYVACLKGREVAVVGTVSDTLLRTVRVGRQPIGVAFDAAGARAYVTNSADDTVTVLDAAADKAIAKVAVGRFPLGVAVSSDGTVWVADSRGDELALLDAGGTTNGTITVPDTPVAIGGFIGTPPSGCPAPPLPCDDANPFTGDACTAGVGCTQAPIPGVDGVQAGVAAIGTILAEHPDDPIAGDLGPLLPALASAVEAAETGGDRTALRLVRRTLKPVLTALERARRHGSLGASGAQLLDIAREARRELKKLGRHGNTG